MVVYECDSCKKKLKDRDTSVSVTIGYFQSFLLCTICGKSIIESLKKKGLEISKVK